MNEIKKKQLDLNYENKKGDYILYVIYGIFCKETGKKYVGSTKNLYRRISEHKKKNSRCVAKEIIALDNYDIYILAELYTNDPIQALICEDFHIKQEKAINRGKIILNPIVYEKVECACGSILSVNSVSGHKKSKKHQSFLAKSIN
jgi:hypothetical protein